MTNSRVFPVILSASAVAPVMALADVTAEDVLTNMMAPARAFGFEVTAEPVREGDSLRVDNMVMTYALPMDAGVARLSSNGFTLTEQGDGSVALNYSDGMTAEVTFTLPDEGKVMSATLSYEGFDTPTVATGTPGLTSTAGRGEIADSSSTFSPMPRIRAAREGMQTGTSAPSASVPSGTGISCSRASALSTAAASADPPPSPASEGRRFSSRIAAGNSMKSAARAARLSLVFGAACCIGPMTSSQEVLVRATDRWSP